MLMIYEYAIPWMSATSYSTTYIEFGVELTDKSIQLISKSARVNILRLENWIIIRKNKKIEPIKKNPSKPSAQERAK